MTQKLRYFCTLLLMAVVGVAWAQTTYTKVTTAPADWSGTYVIIADDSEKIFTGQSGSNNYGGHADVTISSESVTGNYSDYEVLVEKSGDYYTMKHVSSGKYLGWNSGNNLHFSTEVPTTNAFKWNLSTSSILNANDNARKLQYNSGSPRFACYTSSQKVAYLYLKESVSPTTVATTTTIDASGITNTDVYLSTEAGSLSAVVTETESGDVVAGAPVTWTSSKENVATIDENGVVTLVAAGTTTITATYAGVSGEFGSSSATYELTVTSSAPYEQPTTIEITPNYEFWGQNAQFSGSTYNELSGEKDNVTLEWTKGAGSTYASSSAMRFYKDNTLTFTAPTGYEIKSIEFTFSSAQTDFVFSPAGYSTETTTWTGSSSTVTMSRPSNASSYAQITKITIVIGEPSSDPSISAEDVNIAYDATSGEIAYTINNPVPGTLLQATADADWVSDIIVGDEAITFTTTANEANTERVATFTLTYEGAEDKTVTVTQAAAPVVYTTIPDLFAAATSTATDVNVQFNNWVVTGVSTNGRNVFVTDGTNGFAIYDGSGSLASTYAVGNTLTGLASCKLKLQNGYAQLQDVNAADLTIGTGGSVDFATITMADLAGVNTGALVQYDNLTCSVDDSGTTPKYYLTDGTTTLQVYNSLYADAYSTLVDGKTYNIKGVYQQYNTTKEILPRSAADIEEVTPTVPTVTVNPTAVEVDAAEHDGTITVSCENMGENLDISVFFCEETDVTSPAEYDWITADIDNENNVYYIIEANTATEARTAYMVVKVADADAKEVYTSKLITFTQAGKELPSVTWDLTTDSYSSASEDLVTWTSDFATMTNAKGSSTTKANNYLGGDNNHTRFYKNQVLTITPQSGYAVTSIVINAISGYVNGFNGENAWTNATVSVNGAVVTVTPTNINLPVSVTISEACRATGVKVYYEESDVMVIEIKNGFTATTFSCNKALDFTNADVTAQIITDEVGTTQTVTVVPAETGLYITGEPGIHEIPVADASAETDNVDSNKLKAVMEASQFATQNSVTFYAFGKQKGKEAFYKIPTSGYNVPAGKAVLRITKANAPEMIVVNGGTTGVDSLELTVDSLDGDVFDLSGRKLSNGQIQKGIYIVGGRKVVVK